VFFCVEKYSVGLLAEEAKATEYKRAIACSKKILTKDLTKFLDNARTEIGCLRRQLHKLRAWVLFS
jgi:hypothetical protein